MNRLSKYTPKFKAYIVVMFYQDVPIWDELIFSSSPPDLGALNKQFGFFGDSLFAKEITDERILTQLKKKYLAGELL